MDENFTTNNTTPENNETFYTPSQDTPSAEKPIINTTGDDNSNAANNTNTAMGASTKTPPMYNQYQSTYYQPNINPPYSQQPHYTYPQQQYNTPINSPEPQNGKEKKKVGKTIFIVLICCCIILASLAIGADLMKGDNEAQFLTPSETNTTGEGAVPVTEDSPSSYTQYSGEGVMSAEQVYQSVKDINVGILVYSQNKSTGEGSGIVVGPDKANEATYILTAAHVISDANVSVQVQFNDGTEYDAEIVGFDQKTDVGVLKINATGFASATFGNSDKLMVGQTVYAIGNPGGTEFFGSFTSGLISAIDRPVPTSNTAYDLPCVQHNAAINPGNSGGALVNQFGQVIGLNSSKISSTEYEGMGFSVPSNTVLEVYNEIVTYGYVTNRPMLGILYFPVSSDYTYSAVAWKNNLPYGSVVISTINPNSDLVNHKIEIGDVIIGVNGKKLTTTDILLEEIEKAGVGDKITLTICKLNNDGTINSTANFKVTLVEDKGNNTPVTQQSTESADPFHGYFENF